LTKKNEKKNGSEFRSTPKANGGAHPKRKNGRGSSKEKSAVFVPSTREGGRESNVEAGQRVRWSEWN